MTKTDCVSLAIVVAAVPLFCTSLIGAEPAVPADWRAFDAGHRIFSSGYIDQPYVVVLQDKSWLCVFTTGAGREGAGGQHVVASRSSDQGRTWSQPVDIEPADGPAASWAMPYRTKYGRVYVFYDYNGDRIDTLQGRRIRNDMLGWYCYKFTNDGGRSWSDRYRLPVRVTACDRGNDFKGEVQIFWGIDKADNIGDGMMFGFTKLGKYALDLGEGWFFRCDNINTEKDPARLDWQMLPEGEHGVRHEPFGSVQEEHNLVPLSDGRLYCVYRTTLGYPAESCSADGGRNWSEPRLVRYADGTLLKNSRACPRLFRCRNGKYLFWFHNHSGTGFQDRNPVWLSGGIEKDGRILWSQPEILIYSHDTSVTTGRFSYPDLIEQDGQYWTTCTNKETGRVHRIPSDLLEGLWAQLEANTATVPAPKPTASFSERQLAGGQVRLRADRLSIDSAVDAGGFTIDMTVKLKGASSGTLLLDARDEGGNGVTVSAVDQGRLKITLSSGNKQDSWTTDPGILTTSRPHRITAIVDNGPKIITWLVDGRLCDGGKSRQYGWTRYDRGLGNIKAASKARVAPSHLLALQVFNRPLRTSEAVALHKSNHRSLH
ncbi:MAG: exo-alpha-sialidase [Pirellulaceae bacterium]